MNSVGEILSKARKKQGRSVIQAEEVTKIPSKYIKALETDQFHLIPGDVYVKGFLRTYALYLGLDYLELIKEYKKIQKPPLPKKEAETALITSTFKRRSPKKWAALAVTVLIISFLGGLLWLGSIEKKPAKVLSGKAKREKTSPKKEREPKPSSKSQPAPVAPPSASAITIMLRAIGRYPCRINVVVDGDQSFEGTIQPGEEKEWHGNQSILVQATNVRGLQVIKNGADLGIFAKSGNVAERAFTPEQ